MRFKIGEKVYDAAGIDRLTLGNILRLEKETAELGRPMKWSELQGLAARVSGLSEDEFGLDDETPWFIALTVWASRLNAGEDITFAEAIDFRLDEFQPIAEPEDHKPGKAQKSRQGSGRDESSGTGKAGRAKMSAIPSSVA